MVETGSSKLVRTPRNIESRVLHFRFQILCRRPVFPLRQQDLVRVRLRGEDGLRQPGLQLKQLGTAQAASDKVYQRTPIHGKGSCDPALLTNGSFR